MEGVGEWVGGVNGSTADVFSDPTRFHIPTKLAATSEILEPQYS